MAVLLERLTSPHRAGELVQAINPRWGAWLPGARPRGVIESVRPIGIDAAVVRITPPRRWPPHRPGQFLGLGVDVDGVLHHRSFTITSLPGDDHLELTVQATPEGLVSRHLVSDARPGDLVRLDRPAGDFTLPASPGPLLFVAGGSGITPFVAMLRHLAVEFMRGCAPRPDVVLVQHVRSRRAALHLDELTALDAAMPWLRIEVVVTRGHNGAPRPGVHLDRSRLDELCADWRDRTAFACGPRGLLDTTVGLWRAAGLDGRLRTESFGGPAMLVDGSVDPVPASAAGTAESAPAPAAEAGGRPSTHTATFLGSSRRVGADTTTPLLAVAEAAGFRPPYGCRMGICHTCSTPLAAGRVRDLRTGELVPRGCNVQLCVSAAASDVVLDLRGPEQESR